MLYYFLVPLIKQYRILNVFTYISFRAVGAAVTALVLSFVVGPIILRALRRQAVHQVVREGTPDSHGSFEKPVQWKMTASSVTALGKSKYVESVHKWTRSVMASLRASDNDFEDSTGH